LQLLAMAILFRCIHYPAKFVGTVFGTDCLKNLQIGSKCLQTDSAYCGRFCRSIQEVPKSLEVDKGRRLAILSLLRMPISPLRRKETRNECNPCRMNPSTVVRGQRPNPRYLKIPFKSNRL
jgi:hypothetical protein